MKETMREKLLQVRDFILAHGKIVFPILLIAAVAVTVMIALKAGTNEDVAKMSAETTQTVSADDVGEIEVPDLPLELNAYPEVNSLIATYYEATASGDAEAIASIQSSIEDMERIRIQELGKYIENYSSVDVYTKPGPEENSYIVIAYTKVVMTYYPDDYLPGYASFYVCTSEDGTLYVNQETVPDEISEYIRKVILQDDVVELCNKITVEYKDICIEKPELFNYISEVEQEVKAAAGVILAQQISDASGGDAAVSGGDAQTSEEQIPTPEDLGPVYATANDTVNVRSSDSVEADKLGKLQVGIRVQVLEQKANGWSKIVYEGKDGFIKSEFLNLAESADGVETIGTVTAIDNVNVRASANQAAEKLGVVTTGETLELVANEGEWCKVIYNGQIGYVKAEFIQ
ncbi:MAG TPA: SH3 domain-containing protein [Lachnospiraceae bacterium]|nr:SH3 domain-containing protein [Lachnospiraceae bacterium]